MKIIIRKKFNCMNNKFWIYKKIKKIKKIHKKWFNMKIKNQNSIIKMIKIINKIKNF
jgi:hypothetical protein